MGKNVGGERFMSIKIFTYTNPYELESEEFWDDIRWLAWELKYYIPELLQERRCIRNITALSNKIIDLRYIQNKSEFYTLDILRENLPQYPEELFFSDWIIGID